MVSPNFRNLPKFQSKIRKRETTREAQGFAVPHIDDIVSEAGSKQAGREEFGKGKAQQLDLQKKGFDLSKRRFDLSKELTAKRETARRNITDQNLELDKKRLSLRSEQDKWATGLEVANIGVEGMGALSSIRAAEKEAEEIQLITNSFLELIDKFSEGPDPLNRNGGI